MNQIDYYMLLQLVQASAQIVIACSLVVVVIAMIRRH